MDVGEITQEQLDALESEVGELKKFKDESAPKLEQYQKAQTEFDALKSEKERLEKEVNPNWKEAREQMDRMKELLKGKGVEIDEHGNPKGQTFNADEVINKAKEAGAQAAQQQVLGDRLEELLDEYDNDSKEKIRYYYNKLSTGETVTIKNIRKFVSAAERAASDEVKITRVFTGQGPRQATEEVLSEARANDLGSKMNLPFVNAKKN